MTITRKPLALIAFLLFIGLWCGAANACPKSNCVRIGAWNVEWLGSEKRSQPVDQQTIDAMADLIANQLSIDVISLEEINTELNGKVRGENYSLKPWQDLQRALKHYGYETGNGNSGGAQHVVLAWRKPVLLIQPVNEIAIPDHYELHEYCQSSHLRKPLAGLFRADQFDFWVVGLHLKANGQDAKCTAAVRKAQSQALANALNPLIKKDADVIIVGDFNASGHHASLQALSDIGFQTLDDKKMRSTSSASHSYHSETSKKANTGSLLDHIMVNPASTREWQPRSTVIYKPGNPTLFAKTFSDHVPLWADFYTRSDDD